MTDARHIAVSALLRQVAAEVVLPRFQHLDAAEIEEKAKDDLVTIADREAEVALAKGLAEIDGRARIVGEEACAADPTLLDTVGDGRVWLIDPVDGTNNFAAGRTPFGMMIALVEDGVPQAGWLYDPVADRMCHAVRGGGAFIDGTPVTARATGAAEPVAALATYFMSDEDRAALADRVAGKLTLVEIPRCAAEQYPRLVLGENDLALFQRTLPWDHAAGVLFLEEAGGHVARADGSPYRVGDNRRGMLGASSPALWEQAAPLIFG
ncbi:inositol monophosphatase [Sphingomonas sp. PL-96]|uniref:inositol monophosphatase family protein n=1 Tax=Sphingomonas sp. PL-96 TaxID=2887201 RepID=UPI001E5525AF|nr:inositol monophosphatase family protein [Sphingomonas sp. PL-96]MCC2976205.1 inositol monophosphatase [Sphingomonas sp. PL-96]